MTFMHLCLKRVQGSNMTGSQPHFPNYFFTVLSFSPLFSQGQSVVSTKCTSLTHLTNHANNQRPLTAFEAGPFDSRRCVQPTTISHQFMDSCLGPRIAHEKSIQRNSIRVWAAVYKNRVVSRGRMHVLISFSRWPSRLQQEQDAPHGVPLYLLILKIPF